MKLPHSDHAIIDIAKLRDYCLNPLHPEGKRKARVFATLLSFTPADAETLRNMILRAITTEEAIEGMKMNTASASLWTLQPKACGVS